MPLANTKTKSPYADRLLILSILDVVIVLLLAMRTWRGYRVGAVRTFFSLISWLVAFVVAMQTAQIGAPIFATVADTLLMQKIWAFCVIFVGVLIVLRILAAVLVLILRIVLLGFVDRLLGGLLGFFLESFKIVLVLSVFAPIVIKTDVWQHSQIAPMFLPAAEVLADFVQASWRSLW